MPKKIITQKRLKELLKYDPKTGVFVWLVSPRHNAKAGGEAGTLNHNGYIHIRIDSKSYQAHRLAIFYVTGKWPVEVDHDDHVKRNNRWKNINSVTHKTNGKNQSIKINNTSKVTGVHYHKASGKWCAAIMVEGKRIHLGLFIHKLDAIKVRKDADVKYEFHKNHGK